jgi:hypothetical protein
MTVVLFIALVLLILTSRREIHHIYELVAGAQTSRPPTQSSSKLFHEYN